MGLFDSSLGEAIKIQAIIIEFLVLENTRLWKELNQCHKPKSNPVKLIYINNKNQQIMDLNLELPGSPKTGTPQLIDTVTNQPVPATFGQGSALVGDPSIATVSVDANGTASATPLAVGATTVVITTPTTYTNSLGELLSTDEVTDSMTITVTAKPTANGVKLEYTWS